MALINCPECGEKISSSTTQCIHCGCNIKVCPECGEIYKGDIVECEKCGFRFIKKAVVAADTIKQKDNCIDVYNEWKSSSVLNGIFHFSTIISVFITLLSAFLAVVASSKLSSWINAFNTNDLETLDKAIMSTSSVRDDFKILIIFSCILIFAEYVYKECCRLVGSQSLMKWFTESGIDISSSIKEYLLTSNFSLKTKQGIQKDGIILAKLIDAYMLSDIVYMEKRRNKAILYGCLYAVFIVFQGIFCLSNVETAMQQIFLHGVKDFSWSCITNWWLLIAGAVGIFVVESFTGDSLSLIHI